MIVEQVTQKNNWNDFIASCSYGDILQSWEWGEVKKGEFWQPFRFVVKEDGEVVAQALVFLRKLPLGRRMFYAPRGPVLDYASPKADQILEALFEAIKAEAQKQQVFMLKMGPGVGEADVPGVHERLLGLGLKLSPYTVQMKYTWIVDLRPGDADILQSFDKDTRNLVRRAAREGVVVDYFGEAKDVKELRVFHNMYLTTSERGNFPARPWQQMVRLWELMAPEGMAHIYTASFENNPLASSLVLSIGNTAYQLWSGSRRDMEKKFATYALQWAIMQDMKAQGKEYYDMWGAAPDDEPGSHAWSGPNMFKRGFRGKRVEYVGDYDLPLSWEYRLFALADRIRHRMAR